MKKFLLLYGSTGVLMGAYYPLWQPQLMDRGYGLTEIARIITIETVLAMLIEIPSGLWADRFGQKSTTLIGYAFYVVGFLLPAINSSPFALAAAVVVIGVGMGIVNGAVDVWATASQEEANGQGIQNRDFVDREKAERVGFILGALSIPLLVTLIAATSLVTWSILLGVAVSIFIYAFVIPKDRRSDRLNSTSYWEPIKHLGKLCKDRSFLFLFLSLLFFGFEEGVGSTAFWPKIKSFGIEMPFIFGVVQSLLSVTRLIGIWAWNQTNWVDSGKLPGVCLCGAGILGMVFPFAESIEVGLPIWLLRIAILSAFFPLYKAILLKKTSEGMRASILSAAGLLISLGTVVSAGIIGILPPTMASMNHVLLVGGFFSVVAGVFWWIGNSDFRH